MSQLTMVCSLVVIVLLNGCGKPASPNPIQTHGPAHPALSATAPITAPDRVMVSLTNTISTTMLYRRTTPPPWEDGSRVTIRFTKSANPKDRRAEEEIASWSVVNMHAENLSELAQRLKLERIEVSVLHRVMSSVKILDEGKPPRMAVQDEGYAVISDARIPREWFTVQPMFENIDAETKATLVRIAPGSYRKGPKP